MKNKKNSNINQTQVVTEVNNQIYKKSWFWLLVILIGALGIAKISSKSNIFEEVNSVFNSLKFNKSDTSSKNTKKNHDKEAALERALLYSETSYMSKEDLYEQLIFEGADNFDSKTARYAVDHVKVDWNQIALKKAEELATSYYSKEQLFQQLSSPDGEMFTEEQARYAVEHVKADWNKNALDSAKNLQESFSLDEIKEQLESEEFSAEQVQYALDHLPKKEPAKK